MWNLPGLNQIIVDLNPPVLIISQMQDIGYQSRNAVYALGTFTFIIYLYFLKLGFLILIKIVFKILNRSKKRKNLLK